MKTVKLFVFILSLLCFSASYTQGSVPGVHPKVARKAASSQLVHRRSRSARKITRHNLRALYQPPRTAPDPDENYFVVADKPTVFRLQRHETSSFPASAFAVEMDGHIFGVTAGHVIYNTAQLEERKRLETLREKGQNIPEFIYLPFARFRKDNGEFLLTQIKSWQLSNIYGTDVAVFEIPQEALPYIKPLPINTERIKPFEVAKLSGYITDQTFVFPTEEVLVSTPYRMLLRNNSDRPTTGMCGSPVMIDGKVAGIYVGFFSDDNNNKKVLSYMTQSFSREGETFPDLHLAAPISLIKPLIRKMLLQESADEGLPLKAAGYFIAKLQPEERISSVELIRDNKKIESVGANELTDPARLDQFFTLQPEDILRVYISSSSDGCYTDEEFIYELNVSSGEVVRRENTEE